MPAARREPRSPAVPGMTSRTPTPETGSHATASASSAGRSAARPSCARPTPTRSARPRASCTGSGSAKPRHSATTSASPTRSAPRPAPTTASWARPASPTTATPRFRATRRTTSAIRPSSLGIYDDVLHHEFTFEGWYRATDSSTQRGLLSDAPYGSSQGDLPRPRDRRRVARDHPLGHRHEPEHRPAHAAARPRMPRAGTTSR